MRLVKEPMPTYRAAPGHNWSTFKHALTSASWARLKRDVPVKGSSLGRLVHCLTLDPDAFGDEFVVSPFDSFRTNEAKAWKVEQETKGMDIAADSDVEQAKAMRDALLANEIFSGLLGMATAQTEVSCYGEAEVDGVMVQTKCRFDLLIEWPNGDVWAVDLKTCGAMTPAEFCRVEAVKLNYLGQAGHYGATHGNVDKWLWCCVNDKTHDVFFVEALPAHLEAGKRMATTALETYVRAERSGVWAAAQDSETIHPATFPDYYLDRLAANSDDSDGDD
jgi:hypothetical protein